MANFPRALDFTLAHEGGTNFNIHDRGGLTKYGISQKQYPDLDIANLSIAEAESIYRKDYWLECSCNLMENSLSYAVFDTGVNCGAHSVKVWIQKSLRVTVDGILGQETMEAVMSCDQYKLACKVLAYRLSRYCKIVNRSPGQRVFVVGWMSRVSDLLLFI